MNTILFYSDRAAFFVIKKSAADYKVNTNYTAFISSFSQNRARVVIT